MSDNMCQNKVDLVHTELHDQDLRSRAANES